MSIGFARRVALTLAVTVAAGLFVSAAQAGLVIDLRLKGVTGTAFDVVGPKKVQYTYDGTGTIKFEAWAIITGADGNPGLEGLLGLFGSFYSKNVDGGVVYGDLSSALAPNWKGTAYVEGGVKDLDGDGDLDVGSNVHTSAANWFSPISSIMPSYLTPANSSNVPPDAFEALPDGGYAVKLADLSFELTSGIAAPPVTAATQLTWVGRNKAPILIHPATWQEDGVTGKRLPNLGDSISSTGPIEIVPEPASIALVTLLGAIAMVWFRRR